MSEKVTAMIEEIKGLTVLELRKKRPWRTATASFECADKRNYFADSGRRL